MNEQLQSLIEVLKEDKRLKTYDEASTKQSVILRVLSLLNWDTFNISEVRPEYPVKKGNVDYALIHNGSCKVFIEVKRVGTELEKHQEQLLEYSFKEGVQLAILTDGIAWWFYLPLEEGSWEERKFFSIDIYDQQKEDITKHLFDYLHKENVITGKSKDNAQKAHRSMQKDQTIKATLPKSWDKLLSEPDESLVELIADATEKLCGYKPDNSIVEDFISSNIVSGRMPAQTPIVQAAIKKVTFTKHEGYTGKSAAAFVFNNERYEIKFWIEIIISICRLMYKFHRSRFEGILQLKGRKRPYFTKNPNELRSPQRIEDSDIYMETNLSSQQIVKISYDVISLFGYSANDFSVVTR